MATKTTTPASIDPLEGLPVGKVKTAPEPAAPAPTAAPGTTVIPFRKKGRLTGKAYTDARDFARKTTGYDASSPIWGKRMPVVFQEIRDALAAGDIETADNLVSELQKRIATGLMIKAQS